MGFAREVACIVAACAAICSLQGCGMPDVIKVPCDSTLSPLLAAVAANETDYTASLCLKNFKATEPQNGCLRVLQQFINQARVHVFDKYMEKCAAFVKTSVCERTEECEKLLPSVISERIAAWATSSNYEQAMRTEVKATISDLVTKDYDYKYYARQVPYLIKQTCEYRITKKLSNEDMLPAQEQIFKVCNSYTSDCTDNGFNKLAGVKQHEVNAFADKCTKAALEMICPKHSKCAIDTSLADVEDGVHKVKSWLFDNLEQWIEDLKRKYMQSAQTVVAPTRLYAIKGEIFNPKSMSSGLCLVLGALFISAAFAAIVVFRRRRQNFASQRCISRCEDSRLLELVEAPVEE